MRLGGATADGGARWRRGCGRSGDVAAVLRRDREAAGTGIWYLRPWSLGRHGKRRETGAARTQMTAVKSEWDTSWRRGTELTGRPGMAAGQAGKGEAWARLAC